MNCIKRQFNLSAWRSGSLLMIFWFAIALPAQAFDIQRWTSPGGAKVLLVARHDNPIVDIDIAFDAGSRPFRFAD